MMSLSSFFAGIMVLAFLASGLFFLKFWKASKDIFFLLFSLACMLIAMERGVGLMAAVFLPIPPDSTETRYWIFLLRLMAFILILTAIILRNRGSKSLKSRE